MPLQILINLAYNNIVYNFAVAKRPRLSFKNGNSEIEGHFPFTSVC
jgi:hypothetical protein